MKAASITKALIKASNSDIVANSGTSVVVRGSNNSVRYAELDRLTVIGANNRAKVAKRTTTVKVKGPNNVIRVKNRA